MAAASGDLVARPPGQSRSNARWIGAFVQLAQTSFPDPTDTAVLASDAPSSSETCAVQWHVQKRNFWH